MRICPACKIEIANDNAKFCKKCGAKLPPSKCQINETNEDVTRQTNGDITLSENIKQPVNNTDGENEKDVKLDSCSKNENVKENVFEQEVQAPLGETNDTTIPSVYTSEWLKSNTQIKGWLIFFLLAIFVGGLISAISSFTNFNAADYGGNIWLGAVDIFIGVCLFAIAIYTIYAFIQRKPNALFYGRLYVFLVFATNIISAIGGDLEFGTVKQVVRGIIWSIIWFFYLLLSDQVQRVIPKAYRKVKASDWSILAVFIMISIFCFAIGVTILNSKDYSTENITTKSHEDSLTDTMFVDKDMEGEKSVEDKSPKEKNLSFLKKAILEANDSYPMNVEEGIIAKKCYLDGEYVMYDYECDEDVVDMDILSQNKSNVKRVIKKNLKNADAETLMFKRMCEKANKGIGYKYIGKTSGKAVFIKFSCQELKNNSKISGIDKKMPPKHVSSKER